MGFGIMGGRRLRTIFALLMGLGFLSSGVGAQTQQDAAPGTVPSTGASSRAASRMVYVPVLHDHGSAQGRHCVGFIGIGNGVIQYRSTNRIHVFKFPISEVVEAKKNDFYMNDLGAFHIKLKNGADYNFIVLSVYGQFEPPDTVLAAITRAMKVR
jgi:hypothetical protein